MQDTPSHRGLAGLRFTRTPLSFAPAPLPAFTELAFRSGCATATEESVMQDRNSRSPKPALTRDRDLRAHPHSLRPKPDSAGTGDAPDLR
jgi:hypothetical protein